MHPNCQCRAKTYYYSPEINNKTYDPPRAAICQKTREILEIKTLFCSQRCSLATTLPESRSQKRGNPCGFPSPVCECVTSVQIISASRACTGRLPTRVQEIMSLNLSAFKNVHPKTSSSLSIEATPEADVLCTASHGKFRSVKFNDVRNMAVKCLTNQTAIII